VVDILARLFLVETALFQTCSNERLFDHYQQLFDPFEYSLYVPLIARWISSALQANANCLKFELLLVTTCDDMKLQAKTPRNRVFALLGLVEEREKVVIVVDYSQSRAILFADTTRYLLLRFISSVLPYCELANSCGLVDDLPSWAIDLTCTRARGQRMLSAKHLHQQDVPFHVRMLGSRQIFVRAAPVDWIAGVAADLHNLLRSMASLMLYCIESPVALSYSSSFDVKPLHQEQGIDIL
jgi:hypothetical protein